MLRRAWPACLALLAGLSVAAGIAHAREAATEVAAGLLLVEIDGGEVTLEARDVAVEDLLEAVALAGGLEVDSPGRFDERASLDLDVVPIRQALRRILRGRNFAVRYAPAGTLWVFPSRPRRPDAPDRRAGFASAPAHGEAKTRLAAIAELADSGRETDALAAAALFDGDAAVREEAVYGLGLADEEAAVRILEQALGDPARRVRRAAVEAIADVGGDESAWALATALRDADPALREQAVYALGDIGGAAAVTVVRQALADERDVVREAAREVLDELRTPR